MIYKILSFWLCFSFCSTTFAQQTLKINGFVVDASTLEPIEGANIIGNNLFAVTTSSGDFNIKNVTQGNYTFEVSHIGYIPEIITVQVTSSLQKIKIELKEKATNLDEIVIFSKSKKNKMREVSTVLVEVSEEFLNKNRGNSLMQTLKKIPGVSTINIGSGQSKPVIRGLGFNRVSVVQNGVKHEAQQWGNDHGLEIDQYGIENIQIIKGPASLLYGSDAIAGVVNIKPSKIPLINSFKGEVNLLGESNNELLGFSIGLKARKDKWYYGSRLTLRNYGDYKVPTDRIKYDNYIFELNDRYLRNTAGKETNLSFNIGYTDNKVKSETFISNVNAKNGFFANAHGLEVRTSKIDYDRSNRDIQLPFHKVNHFKITNNTSIISGQHTFYVDLGYQNNIREEYAEPVPHGYMPKPSSTKEREFNKNTYTLNVRDSFKPNNYNTIVGGLNLELQDNSIGGWGFLIPKYKRLTAGVFACNQLKINSRLHFQAGLRYDYGFIDTKPYFDWYPSIIKNNTTTSYVYLQRSQDKLLNFENFSASTGVSYIRENTTYKINLGKSFRVPLANELASDGVNYHMYRYEKGNLNLKAEESYQLDIDVDHNSKLFNLGLSPFVNFFNNYIYLNPTPNYYETLQIYQYTQSKVFRVGGEIKLSTTLTENIELKASGEYVFSKQTSGEKKEFTLPFSPPLSGLFVVNFKVKDFFIFKKPTVISNYRITAAQDDIVPPEEKTKGYQVLHMYFLAEMNFLKQELPVEMKLKLDNVFNTKYYNHTSFYRLIDVPEAGRNISVSLTIPF